MSDISRDQTTHESPDKWVEVVERLVDKLVGKNMSMTYDFQRLTIDVPKAEGPGGKHIGSAQWIINGKITITSEAYERTGMRSNV